MQKARKHGLENLPTSVNINLEFKTCGCIFCSARCWRLIVEKCFMVGIQWGPWVLPFGPQITPQIQPSWATWRGRPWTCTSGFGVHLLLKEHVLLPLSTLTINVVSLAITSGLYAKTFSLFAFCVWSVEWTLQLYRSGGRGWVCSRAKYRLEKWVVVVLVRHNVSWAVCVPVIYSPPPRWMPCSGWTPCWPQWQAP